MIIRFGWEVDLLYCGILYKTGRWDFASEVVMLPVDFVLLQELPRYNNQFHLKDQHNKPLFLASRGFPRFTFAPLTKPHLNATLSNVHLPLPPSTHYPHFNMSNERTFTLFPALPKELRLMIWQAALPGPRVVHLQQRKLQTTIGEWEHQTGRSWPVFPDEMSTMNSPTLAPSSMTGNTPGAIYLSRLSQFQQRVMRGRINNALGVYERASTRYCDAKMLGLYSPTPGPEIVLVCREAFDIVCHSYARMFAGPASFAQTWFNGAIDTLYVRFDTYWVYPLGGPIVDINDGFPVLDVESLRMVKRLAILWDLGLDAATIRPRPLVEDWTAPVLKLFGCVEELVLVLRHYGDELDGGDAAVHLIDPIWVDEAMEKYNRIISDPRSEDTLEVRPMDMGIGGGGLDMELLEQFRQHFGEGNPTWAMPRFLEKVAVTERVKRMLDEARCNAEMVLEGRAVTAQS